MMSFEQTLSPEGTSETIERVVQSLLNPSNNDDELFSGQAKDRASSYLEAFESNLDVVTALYREYVCPSIAGDTEKAIEDALSNSTPHEDSASQVPSQRTGIAKELKLALHAEVDERLRLSDDTRRDAYECAVELAGTTASELGVFYNDAGFMARWEANRHFWDVIHLAIQVLLCTPLDKLKDTDEKLWGHMSDFDAPGAYESHVDARLGWMSDAYGRNMTELLNDDDRMTALINAVKCLLSNNS